MKSIHTINDLRNAIGHTEGQLIFLKSYYNMNENPIDCGGGGFFYWTTDRTSKDDGGVVIVPTISTVPRTGCWKRQIMDGIIYTKDFGAKGDGTKYDTDALKAAFNAVGNNGSIVFSPGNYVISDTVFLSGKSKVNLALNGATITQNGTRKISLIIEDCENIFVEGGYFIGLGSDYKLPEGYGGKGIAIYNSSKVTIKNVDFYKFAFSCVDIETGNIADISVLDCRMEGTGKVLGNITPNDINQFGVYCLGTPQQTGLLRIERCDISHTCQGIFAAGSGWRSFVGQNNHIHDIDGQHGIYVDFVSRVNISNNTISNCYGAGIKYQVTNGASAPTYNITINNNTIEDCSSPIFCYSDPSDLKLQFSIKNMTIEGNTIWCTESLEEGNAAIDVRGALGCSIIGNDIRGSNKYSIRADGNGISIKSNNCIGSRKAAIYVRIGRYRENWKSDGSYLSGHIVLGEDNNLYEAKSDGGQAKKPVFDENETYWRSLHGQDIVHIDGNTIIDAWRNNDSTRCGMLLDSQKVHGRAYIHDNIMIDGKQDLSWPVFGYPNVDLYMWDNNFSDNCGAIRINGLLKMSACNRTKGWYFAGGTQGPEGEGTRRVFHGSSPPTTGYYYMGDVYINSSPTLVGSPIGWVCIIAGDPGIWSEYGSIFLRSMTTWNPGELDDREGVTSSDITVSGAQMGDPVFVGASYNLQGLLAFGYVRATNQVRIRLQNETGGVINLGSGTWYVKVAKY